MDPPALDGYLREICQQCWLALLASMQLRDLLHLGAERPSLLDRPDASRVWHLQCWQAVQTILSSGAALSRVLWPGPPGLCLARPAWPLPGPAIPVLVGSGTEKADEAES
jgi:hypothetical protein